MKQVKKPERTGKDGERKQLLSVFKARAVQLETVEPKFSQGGRTVITGRRLSGTGLRMCGGMVFVWNPNDVYLLERYNRDHKDYVAIFSKRLDVRYRDLSNSSVAIIYDDLGDIDFPKFKVAENQLESAIRSSGKLFFSTPMRGVDWEPLKKYKQTQTENGAVLEIYPITVRVTASERQQKAIVEIVG
jgi:hypothetical protein